MPDRKPHRSTRRERSRQLSPRKRLLFACVALALPFLALAILEVGLRLAGFGGGHPFFREMATLGDGRRLITTDSRALEPFFLHNKSSAGKYSPSVFEDPKPASVVRVLLVGGSAVKGYPHARAFTIDAFLAAMLGDVWPEREVDVLNFGATAVASYPALEVLRASLEFDPDLVVVFAGNNEFFGAYGVASLNTLARSARMIDLQHRLRSLATVQLASSLVSGQSGGKKPAGRMLMETMIGQSYIAPDDPVREAAAGNLRTHIAKMLGACEAAGVPAIVCTLPANERGLAPLGESVVPGLSEKDRARFEAILERAAGVVDYGLLGMIGDLRWAVETAPEHARARWLLARALDEAGEHTEAAKEFDLALDLDPMPWRATSAQNEAVIEASKESNAILADVRTRFRDASPGGSTGWELMDDHVHMSIEGQALAARAIVESLVGRDGELRVDEANFARLATDEAYMNRLRLNDFERYGAAHRMIRLFELPFFQSTNEHAMRLTSGRIASLASGRSPQERAAAEAWKDQAINPGYRYPISAFVGKVHLRANNPLQAEPYLGVAARCFAPYTGGHLEFGALHLGCLTDENGTLLESDREEARALIEQGTVVLETGGRGRASIHLYVGRLHAMLGEHGPAVEHLLSARPSLSGEALVEIELELIESYVAVGRLDDALALASAGAKQEGPGRSRYRDREAQLQDAGANPSPDR